MTSLTDKDKSKCPNVLEDEWEKVLKAEWKEIELGRKDLPGAKSQDDSVKTGQQDTSTKPDNLVGLSFSGGGIRSATFNLGVIQALAELRLLRKIDYLSTVSGGGYIGSWLTSWMASHDQTPVPTISSQGPVGPINSKNQGWRQYIKNTQKIIVEPVGQFFSPVRQFVRKVLTPLKENESAGKNITYIEEALAPLDQNGNPVLGAGSKECCKEPCKKCYKECCKEPGALRHLRNYTDYLKPHGGLFSLDAMTAFTTWLRNTLLNQVILFSIFAAILVLPLLLGWLANYYLIKYYEDFSTQAVTDNSMLLWVAASACLAIAVGFINLNIMYKPANITPEPNQESKQELPKYSSQKAVVLWIVLPLVVGSFLLSIMLPSLYHAVHSTGGLFEFIWQTAKQFLFIEKSAGKTPAGMLWLMLGICSAAFLGGLIYIAQSLKHKTGNRRDSSFWIYLAFLPVLALGPIFFLVIAKILISSPAEIAFGLDTTAMTANILTFGPPLILATFSLAVFVNVGLIGREFDEHQREWWSRLVAMIFFVGIAWFVLFGISIWGSLVVAYLGLGLKSAIAWLSASGIGAALGKSASSSVKPEAKGANKWLSVVAQVTPYIFIIGLCLLIVYLLNVSLLNNIDDGVLINGKHSDDLYHARLMQLNLIFSEPEGRKALEVSLLALFFTGLLFSRYIDINVFSFHSFYRNRLTRAYLAAGIEPEDRDNGKLPLTGMNDRDSPRLDRLPSRPYHLLNTALNITSNKHLSWQERKAASFFFSKKYCGYFLPGEQREFNYCRTEDYLNKDGLKEDGWLSLSLPMTISGAAASPNEGYHTSPPLAFLMTVFNVRLGWWMQNTTKKDYWTKKGPHEAITYLFKELVANVDENSPFVYLSDGGHFENLGIYELVRRECRLIIACDAGADPKYEFEDLGNAIRKCYIDLGVRIEIDTSEIKPKQNEPHKGRSLKHCAIGQIQYPGDVEPGILLYIKASMGYSEATDIEHFKATHPDFPHDPTSNQFYTESQFESYRKLGYTLCHRAFDDAKKCVETHDLFHSQSTP